MKFTKSKSSAFAVFLLLFFAAGLGLGAEVDERAVEIERVEQRPAPTEPKPEKKLAKQLTERRRPKRLLEKMDFHYSLIEGYDRNARHNSSHKGSVFTEQEFAASYTDRPSERFIYHLGYELRYDLYYHFNSQTVFAHGVDVRTAYRVSPNLFIEADYDFDYFRRPDFAPADYNGHQIRVGPKHSLIPRRLYHKPFYGFGFKHYTKFKARDASGEDTSDDRQDAVHRLGYEVGFYPTNRLLLRVRAQVGRNDSNDQFRDFYDSEFLQVSPTAIWRISKKSLLSGGFQYQRNNYDERDFSGPAGREDIYSVVGSYRRALTRSVEWILYGTYVKYDGNIPALEFQDSVVGTGFQVNF